MHLAVCAVFLFSMSSQAQDLPLEDQNIEILFEAENEVTTQEAIAITENHAANTTNEYIVPNYGAPSTNVTNESASILVDAWWKILLWTLACVIVACCLMYVVRCCYLLWDCCTDSYWGCCPRCQGWEACCLGKCCQKSPDDDEAILREEASPNDTTADESLQLINETKITVLSSSTVASPKKSSVSSKSNGVNRRSLYPYEDNIPLSNEEAMPQLFHGHYFNLLHLFGVGNGRSEYEITNREEPEEIHNGVRRKKASTNGGSGHHLVIDHGHQGKYYELPEAKFELVPVHIRHGPRGSNYGDKRRSRSLESFSRRPTHERKTSEQVNGIRNNNVPRQRSVVSFKDFRVDGPEFASQILFGKETTI